MIIKRLLSLAALLKKKSFFLFGPRATGKTTLIKQCFSKNNMIFVDLLRSDVYLRLNSAPQELEEILSINHDAHVVMVIDEVQRIPQLLNEVHRLIEEKGMRFLLTGSSARQLRQKGINLLAGRAWQANLYPLTFAELKDFNIDRYFQYGGLPAVYLSETPKEELNAYVKTYLTEEIQAESLVRRIPAFTRFLTVAALTSGQMLNFAEIASDTGVPASTVREYYQILEDTFIGFMVLGWTKTVKRKAIARAKFYLFDLGVRNMLIGIKHLEPKTDLYGQSFEHFIAMELRAYISYRRLNLDINYWCTTHGAEVDFIIGDSIAIEVKSSHNIQDKHLKNLQILQEENLCEHYYVVSFDKVNRKKNNIAVMFWGDFLNSLWEDKIINL